MVDLKVMAYFKISLSTRNWDRAFKIAGPGFGALMAGYVIRQIIRIEKRLCILWNSCAQVNCAVPAI